MSWLMLVVSTIVATMIHIAARPKKCVYTTCNFGACDGRGKEITPALAAKYCRLGFCSTHCQTFCSCLNQTLLMISLEDERRKRLLLETDKEMENLG